MSNDIKLSLVKQKVIQDKQAADENNNISTNLKVPDYRLKQDTFVSNHKKAITFGSILGGAGIAVGTAFLAYKGKLGTKAQGFVENAIKNFSNIVTNLISRQISPVSTTKIPANKREFLAFLKQPKLMIQKVAPHDKQMFLGTTGIKNFIRHSNSDYINPETILERLKKADCVTSLTEEPFKITQGKAISEGRKFSFNLKFKKGKKYHMIFEVHNYIKDGKENWVMRIYDDNKMKNSRSYFTRIGNFIENAYFGEYTHIPCGSFGRDFVLGNKMSA